MDNTETFRLFFNDKVTIRREMDINGVDLDYRDNLVYPSAHSSINESEFFICSFCEAEYQTSKEIIDHVKNHYNNKNN